MSDAILPGAEPWSSAGSRAEGVLVLHGFTGNPSSMRPLAEAVAGAGYAAALPRLPGHGTTVEDMLTTGWADWSAHVEAAYQELAARTSKVAVVGLSMGGTLTAWLASRHPEIAGIVTVNGALEPLTPETEELFRGALAAGTDRVPGIGSDIADPDVKESAYADTPVAPLLSLIEAGQELADGLSRIRCPALVITSRQDHVVPPTAAEYFANRVGGPVRHVWLERSYHVATLDYDQPLIHKETLAFLDQVFGAS